MAPEEARFVTKVVKEAGQGSGQDRDRDHGATSPVQIGEKKLIRGRGGRCGE